MLIPRHWVAYLCVVDHKRDIVLKVLFHHVLRQISRNPQLGTGFNSGGGGILDWVTRAGRPSKSVLEDVLHPTEHTASRMA